MLAVGFGLISPTLIAFAIDRAPEGRRGAGLATFTASYQIAYSIAALVSGFVIERWGFLTMFQLAFVPLGLGLVLMLRFWAAGRLTSPRLPATSA